MRPPLKRLHRFACAALVAVSFQGLQTTAHADWANFGTVSMTDVTHPKLTNGYGCYTDGKDIACDSASSAVSYGTGGLITYGGATVVGTVSASAISATYVSTSVIQVNASSMPCSTGLAGSIRYSATSNTLEICTGTTWSGLSSNTTPGNLSGTGSATAVAFWSGPNSLTYDSKLYWDNVNKRLGVSTTTPSRSFVIQTNNSDGLRLEAAASPSNYYTELVNQYNSSEPFYLMQGNSKLVGRKSMATTHETYLNSYYGLSFVTGVDDPDLAHVRMFISNTGPVGIGTTSPTSTLTLKRPVSSINELTMQADSGSAYVRLGGLVLNRFNYDPTGDAAAIDFYRGAGTSDADIVFRTNGSALTGTSATERMRIFRTGNVGIGTATPTYTLQVSGSFLVSNSSQGATSPSLIVNSVGNVGFGTSAPSFKMEVYDQTSPYLHFVNQATGTASTDGGLIGLNSTGDLQVRQRDALPITFHTNDSEKARIAANGNFGISNTNPIAKLDVWGTISASDIIQVGQNNSIACSSAISGSIRYFAPSNTMEFCQGTDWTGLASGTITGSGISGGSATAIAFWNGPSSLTYESDTTSGLYWDAAGKHLGVGTNSPTRALTVNAGGTTPANGVLVYGTYAPAITISSTTGEAVLGVATNNSHFSTKAAINDAILRSKWGNLLLTTYSPTDVVIAPSDTEVARFRADGKVGIGTLSPTTSLEVSGTATMNMANLVSQSTSNLNGAGGNKIVSGSASVTASSSGLINVIGTVSLTGSIGAAQTVSITGAQPYIYFKDTDVGTYWQLGNGDGILQAVYNGSSTLLRLSSAGTLTVYGSSTCTIGNGTGNTACTSDRRLKDDIHPITGALDKLARINGVTYHWKDPFKSRPEHIGVIAQDVEKVFPQAVSEVSDTTLGTAKTVDYAVLIAPAIEAIKELKADNDNLRADARFLRKEVDALRTEVQEMRKNKR